jgi:hypothetical protein
LNPDLRSPRAMRPSRFDAFRYKVRGAEIPKHPIFRRLPEFGTATFLSVSSKASSQVTRPFIAGDFYCVSVLDD